MKNVMLFTLAMMTTGAWAAGEGPGTVNYQGRVFKSDGVTPLESPAVTFTVQVRSPDGLCLLFEETHLRDMTATAGLFNLALGDGAPTGAVAWTLPQVFDNSSDRVGAGGCVYHPIAGDSRRLRFTYADGNETVTVPMDQTLRSVPYAMNAATVAGLSRDKILQVSSTSTQAKLDAVLAQDSNLLNLAAGSSNQYIKSADLSVSNGVVNLSAGGLVIPDQPAQPNYAVNKNYADSKVAGQNVDVTGLSQGQVLLWDASSSKWKAGTPNAGTLTSVVAGAGLTGGNIVSSGTIALAASGVTAGTYPKVTVDAYGRVTGSAALAESDIPSITTAGKISGSAITSGTIGGNVAINTTGNVSATALSATSASVQNLRIFDASNARKISFAAPAGMSADYSLTLPASAGSLGQVLSSDGAGNMAWSNPAAFAVTAINATAPILVSGPANSPTIGVQAASTSAPGVVQLAASGGTSGVVQASDARLTDSRAPAGVAAGDLGGSFPAPTVAKLQGNAVTSATPFASQVLRGNGAGWAPAYVNVADLKNTIGLPQIPTTCTASQTLIYNSVTDLFECVGISLPLSAVSGAGTVSGITAGTGLTGGLITSSGTIGLSVSGVTSGAYPKVTVDAYGRVTGGAALGESDIPAITTAGKINGNSITSGTIGGNTSINSTGSVKVASAALQSLSVYESTGTNKITLSAPAGLSADYAFTLPAANGSAGQILSIDGSGHMNWMAPAIGGTGTMTGITAGAGLTGGTITTAGTIGLATSGVTAGAYPKVTVDAYGRVTGGAALAESDVPAITTAGKISGSTIISGTIAGSTAINTSGSIKSPVASHQTINVYDASNTNKVSLTAPSGMGADYALVLPSSAGLAGQVLSNDGSGNMNWISAGTVTKVAAGTGLTGGSITGAGTIGVDVGTTANKIVQLDSNGKLPALDGSQLTGMPVVPFGNMQVFNSNGSFTVPAGVTKVYVQAWGAGGGGGGGTVLAAGGGGGGGSYVMGFVTVTPGASISVSVGTGGAAGAAAAIGSSGGTSSFSSISAAGGTGGPIGIGQSAALGGTTAAASGIAGSAGSPSLLLSSVTMGGTGGAAAGGGGAGGQGSPVGSAVGNAGISPGGGGGGGGSNLVVAISAGGAGGAGRVIVWY